MKTISKSISEHVVFLSASETALFFKIKLSTVYALVEKRQIPFYRIGKRKLLFSKDELINILTKHEVLSNENEEGKK